MHTSAAADGILDQGAGLERIYLVVEPSSITILGPLYSYYPLTTLRMFVMSEEHFRAVVVLGGNRSQPWQPLLSLTNERHSDKLQLGHHTSDLTCY